MVIEYKGKYYKSFSEPGKACGGCVFNEDCVEPIFSFCFGKEVSGFKEHKIKKEQIETVTVLKQGIFGGFQ